jgi:hypothetical protein
VFLVPGSFPLTTRDRLRYLRLFGLMRQFGPAYPTRVHLAGLPGRLGRAGFEVLEDQRARFGYPIRDEIDAHRFVASLYFPRDTPERFERAVSATATWAGTTIGIPLRRLVCQKSERPHG